MSRRSEGHGKEVEGARYVKELEFREAKGECAPLSFPFHRLLKARLSNLSVVQGSSSVTKWTRGVG